MIDMENFKVKYDKQKWEHIIAYTFWWDNWYGIKFNEDFDEIADLLLKCNDDVKSIKAKLNRMLWIANTWFWDILWITSKRDFLLDTMFIVELQMYMVTQSVFTHNKKLFDKLQKDTLTSKLFKHE